MAKGGFADEFAGAYKHIKEHWSKTTRDCWAMDESNPTCNKRFALLGIPQTAENRRAYREWIVTTPGLSEFISGAILYDETIRQHLNDGTPFAKALSNAGIIPRHQDGLWRKGPGRPPRRESHRRSRRVA